MAADDEPRKHLILDWIDGILHHTQHVKTGQDGFRQFDVLLEWYGWVISPPNRVGGGHDCTSCSQGRYNTGLGYRDRLLLHCFVNGRTIRIVHLVEFVNETNPFISQHQSAAFKGPLASDWILPHAGSETDGRGTLTGSKDRSMSCLFHVLEELRLGGSWITEHKDVNVTPYPVLVVNVLGDPAK